MPVYEYRCRTCDTRFNQWQEFHDDPVDVCPAGCNGNSDVVKVMSSVNLRVPLAFRQPWTVKEYQKELFEGAKADGRDIQRKDTTWT